MPLQIGRYVFRRHRINIVMVQPQQFICVECAGRFAYCSEREQLDHLFTAEDLLIAAGPAQTHQVVQQSFRQVAIITILHDAHGAVTFGEFLTVITINHGNVGVYRYRRVQRFQDVDLTRGVVDMIFTPDHVSDLHIPVIHNHTEVVGRRTVGTTDDQIVKFLVAEFNWPTDLVVKNNGSVLRVSKTHDARFIIGMMFMAVAAAPVITRLFTLCHLLFTQRVQTFFGAIAFISGTRCQHFINDGVIPVKTFGLEVRTFIPFQIQPVHSIHDGFNCFRR